jgi:predicted Zn-dependent peptidase
MAELVTLGSGIRLFVDPMPELQTAAIGVWANAGAADEAAVENGVAHLLEHMAFKGTKRRSARDIAEEIETVGGYLNAATTYQRTGYYARVLKNDVGLAVDILADILTEPLFDAAELEKEKEVVVQEIGEAADAPDDAAAELLQSAAFADQSIGRPILGTVDSVRSHAPERLRAFMGRLYGANNLVIAASGAIDTASLAAEIEQRFQALPRGGRNSERARPRYVGGAKHDSRDIEQTHVAIAFSGVGTRHPDFFAACVFAEALGGGMASRLFQTVREQRGLAYTIQAYAECYDDAGLIGVHTGTDADKAPEAARLIREQISRLAGEATETELNRSRAVLKASLLMSLENPAGRIEAAAGQIFTFGRPLAPEEICARLDAVGRADIVRCAERALEDAAPSLAVVGAADFEAVRTAVGAAV